MKVKIQGRKRRCVVVSSQFVVVKKFGRTSAKHRIHYPIAPIPSGLPREAGREALQYHPDDVAKYVKAKRKRVAQAKRDRRERQKVREV